MNKKSKLPIEILQQLESSFGIGMISEPSDDFLGPGVFFLYGGEIILMAKRNPHPREEFFFSKIVPEIKSDSVKIPHLVWQGDCEGYRWLVVEATRACLPETRWEADPKVMEYLAEVHKIKPSQDIKDAFHPEWTEDMNQNALGFFTTKSRLEIEPILTDLCHSSQHMFNPETFIIGNPNPKNFGVTKKGLIMAQDWSKVGYGTPALDLAISICTSENMETSRRAATHYLEHHKKSGYNVSDLSQDILRGCVWNYVVFLNKIRLKKIDVPDKLVEHILEVFPIWLQDNPIAA